MVRFMFERLFMVQLVVSSIAILGNTIDSLIVARMLGTDAIAACGMLNPFVILTAAISAIISSGTQIVCSKSIGAGNIGKARRQLGVAYAASMVITVSVVVLGYVFIDSFCLLMGADPGTQLRDDTKAYACGLLPSFISSIPSALTMFVCVSNGDMRRCRIAGISLVCLNIVFSAGSIAIFDAGIFGAGLGTTLSSYLALFYLLGHFRNKDVTLRPSFSGLVWKDFQKIIAIGSPRAAFKACTFLLILLFNNILLDFYGHETVAAYSVVRNAYSIVSFATSTLIYCTNLITSTFYGEENRRALHDVVAEFTRLGLITGIAGFLLIYKLGPVIVLLYLDPGTNIYATACLGLMIMSTALPFCAIAACLQTFFIGTGHQSWGVALIVVSMLVLTPVAGFLAMPFFDELFVFVAIPAGYIIELVLIGCFVAMKNHASPLSASSYLFVPDDFGTPDDRELSFEVRKPDELAQQKARFDSFCQSVDCGEVKDRSFQTISFFTSNCMGRRTGHGDEACRVRVFRKDDELDLIIWSTFGLTWSKHVTRIMRRRKEPLRSNKLMQELSKGARNDRDGAASGRERRANDHAAFLGADLAEVLEGCKYSLSSPFGLERLRVAFDVAEGSEAQGDGTGAQGKADGAIAKPRDNACNAARCLETPAARGISSR